MPTDWREERGLGRLGVRRGGGAVTSVLEEGGCRSRMSGSSPCELLSSGQGEGREILEYIPWMLLGRGGGGDQFS